MLGKTISHYRTFENLGGDKSQPSGVLPRFGKEEV
jgi:hypothetical protein